VLCCVVLCCVVLCVCVCLSHVCAHHEEIETLAPMKSFQLDTVPSCNGHL
jgi:hypothetical protein